MQLNIERLIFCFVFLAICLSCTKTDSIKNVTTEATLTKSDLKMIDMANDMQVFTSKEDLKKKLEFLSLNDNSLINNNKFKNSTIQLLGSEMLDDELVPNPIFRSLLNSKYEIKVAQYIYRITKIGTFQIDADKYDSSNNVIEKILHSDEKLDNTKRQFSFEQSTEDKDFYKVSDGIFRYDT